MTRADATNGPGPDYGSTTNVVREKILSFRFKKLEDYELEEKVEN